ncbi:tetratricopeptide repeat protein [Saccharopolyspora taberi]|uniref:Tetratricopeptide repeat protein n=1 Tax=Saccharopolyspora taberi TaxID=60895 RepID=A0ABN3VDU6_9PSEU
MAEPGNRFDGTARFVVQAGAIHGDVHVHEPARSVPVPFHVPPPSHHYTNNERQLQEITDAVRARSAGPAFVVLQGPPGGGKSDTVYQWLAEHGEDYPDGQFYVSLAGDGAGAETAALRQFLVAVGYRPEELPEHPHALSGWFRSWSEGKRVAVVIDDALTPAQVRALQPGRGPSVVLVTEAGRLSGLRAAVDAEFVELDPMSEESARLLLGRILGPKDDRLDREPERTGELVGLCEGHTLVLSVVGALLAEYRQWPVARLVRKLSDEARQLRTLSELEPKVRAGLNTAVDRLDDEARQCYLAFGQHPGPGDVGPDALVAVLGEDEDDVEDALGRLLSARLIRKSGDRYLAFRQVRAHARGLGGGERFREGFEDFYLHHAIAAGHAVMPGRGWLEEFWPDLRIAPMPREEAENWLDAERGTLRALAERFHSEGREEICQLAVALWSLHEPRKHIGDMDEVNEWAAEVARSRGLLQVEGLALVQRGFAFRHRGEWDKAVEVFRRAREIAAPGSELAATAVESLGLALREDGRHADALSLLRENLAMAESFGKARRLALARMHLGSVAPVDEAVELETAAMRAFAPVDSDRANELKARTWRGKRLTERGDFDAAATDLQLALEGMRELDRHVDVAIALDALGDLALATGAPEQAGQCFTGGIAICRSRGFNELGERMRAKLPRSGQ